MNSIFCSVVSLSKSNAAEPPPLPVGLVATSEPAPLPSAEPAPLPSAEPAPLPTAEPGPEADPVATGSADPAGAPLAPAVGVSTADFEHAAAAMNTTATTIFVMAASLARPTNERSFVGIEMNCFGARMPAACS